MGYRILKNKTEGMDDANLAWAVIEPIWDAVDFSKGQKKVLEVLSVATEGQRLLLALDWCQKEVRNGGLEQFLLNSTGMLSKEALFGFQAIGAIEYATLLEKALAVFPNNEAPVSKTKRTELLRSIPKKEREALFDPLETKFYKLLDNPDTDLEKYRANYVRNHPQEFFID
jgi:hypothetical protein